MLCLNANKESTGYFSGAAYKIIVIYYRLTFLMFSLSGRKSCTSFNPTSSQMQIMKGSFFKCICLINVWFFFSLFNANAPEIYKHFAINSYAFSSCWLIRFLGKRGHFKFSFSLFFLLLLQKEEAFGWKTLHSVKKHANISYFNNKKNWISSRWEKCFIWSGIKYNTGLQAINICTALFFLSFFLGEMKYYYCVSI